MKNCPKCGYECQKNDTECLQCGIVFLKYEAYLAKKNFRKIEISSEDKQKFEKSDLSIDESEDVSLIGDECWVETLHSSPYKHLIPYVPLIGDKCRVETEAESNEQLISENLAKSSKKSYPNIIKKTILGWMLIIIGIIALSLSSSMDTTVHSSYEYKSYLGIPMRVGEKRVHNIGLMNKKQNFIIISSLILLIGVITTIFLSIKANSNKTTVLTKFDKKAAEKINETKECPECAEIIKFRAKICRFCGYQF